MIEIGPHLANVLLGFLFLTFCFALCYIIAKHLE